MVLAFFFFFSSSSADLPEHKLPITMLLKSFTAFLFATAALAVPLDFGIHFGSGSDKMPTLTLPYASYKAYSYDVTDDVSTFPDWDEDEYVWILNYGYSTTSSRTSASPPLLPASAAGRSLPLL